MKLKLTKFILMRRELVGNRKVKIGPKKEVAGQLKPEKIAKMPSTEQEEQKATFLSGMLSRGLIPIENCGDGNCVFISLAQIVTGDSTKYDFIRQITVSRLKSFPSKYHNKSPLYCNTMALPRTPGTSLELQAIADICFTPVECYSTTDYLVPVKVIYPLRFSPKSTNKRCIRLWV